MTRWKDDTASINGNLQFSSRDEARYHEALVLPAMQMVPHAERVLILGGGGLATRDLEISAGPKCYFGRSRPRHDRHF